MQRTLLTIAICVLSTASNSFAAELSDKVSVRGFGTLGFTHSTEDKADFTHNMQQANGPGASEDWGFGLDSKVGLQLNGKITDAFSVVLQTIVKEQLDGEISPDIEWAFLSYEMSDALSVRLGRIVAPVMLYSDTYNVGYSYTWVRPPVDLYYGPPLTTLDGVDVIYRHQFGDVSATFQAATGTTEVVFLGSEGAEDSEADVDMSAVNANFSWDSFNLRIGATRQAYELKSLEEAASMLTAIGFGEVAKTYFELEPVWYYDLGLSYDNGSVLAVAEWAVAKTDAGPTPKSTFAYVSGGYRIADFTPYVTVGFRERELQPYLDASYPSFIAGAVSAVISSLEEDHKSISLGTRWDFAPRMAFKMEAGHYRPAEGNASVLRFRQPGFETGRSYNVYSANIDFIF